MAPVLLEIACFSPEAAAIAADCSECDRLEFCADYSVGGLTPDPEDFRALRVKTRKPVFVMIRPESGFLPVSAVVLADMKRQIVCFKELGADGVVLGAIDAQGHVDEVTLRELVAAAAPLPVTFHRAFDQCPDPREALEALVRCGVSRVLSSGGAACALDGVARIAQLHAWSRGRITVVAGGGIDDSNAAAIVRATGCREIHSSGKPHGFAGGDPLPDRELINRLRQTL